MRARTVMAAGTAAVGSAWLRILAASSGWSTVYCSPCMAALTNRCTRSFLVAIMSGVVMIALPNRSLRYWL